ncbi:MAG: DNA-binding response regulator, partial [Nocardioides sp.]|nr:DNA-binding response regulator [Nocardioides sp.]
MARRVPKSVLTALELDLDAERWYYQVAPVSGHTLEGAAHLLQLSVEELLDRTAGLRAAGLLQVQRGRVVVPPLAEAVARLVRREAETAGIASARLERLAAAVPQLVASSTRPSPDELAAVQPLDGELSVGGNPLVLLTDMLRNSSGDM